MIVFIYLSKTQNKVITQKRRVIQNQKVKIIRKVKVNKNEHLIRGKIFLGSTGEYIGNISFIINTEFGKIRNISLKALPNTRKLSLTKAKYKFTKKGNRYKVMIELSYYEGSSLINVSGKTNNFKLYLYKNLPPLGATQK
jgi:hypothetical protein